MKDDVKLVWKDNITEAAWNIAPNLLIAYVYNGGTLIADFVTNWPGDLTILNGRPVSSNSRT